MPTMNDVGQTQTDVVSSCLFMAIVTLFDVRPSFSLFSFSELIETNNWKYSTVPAEALLLSLYLERKKR
jgi:hypothetical protein